MPPARQLNDSTLQVNQLEFTRCNSFRPPQSATKIGFEPVELSKRAAGLRSSKPATPEEEETKPRVISIVPGASSMYPSTASLSGRRNPKTGRMPGTRVRKELANPKGGNLEQVPRNLRNRDCSKSFEGQKRPAIGAALQYCEVNQIQMSPRPARDGWIRRWLCRLFVRISICGSFGAIDLARICPALISDEHHLRLLR